MRRDEMIKFFPNINKIKKLVRWSPKNNFENKLKLIIDYEKKILILIKISKGV